MTSTLDSSAEVGRKVTFGFTLQCVRVVRGEEGMERVRVGQKRKEWRE